MDFPERNTRQSVSIQALASWALKGVLMVIHISMQCNARYQKNIGFVINLNGTILTCYLSVSNRQLIAIFFNLSKQTGDDAHKLPAWTAPILNYLSCTCFAFPTWFFFLKVIDALTLEIQFFTNAFKFFFYFFFLSSGDWNF